MTRDEGRFPRAALGLTRTIRTVRIAGRIAAIAGTVSLAACGCSDLAGPDTERYLADPVRFACGRWSPAAPAAERALLDVHFGRRGAGDPEDRPRTESLDLVRQLGGEIVHSYHLPMARVILDIDRVPDLAADFVDGVPDAGSVGAEVIVRIPTPLSPADRAFLLLIGAEDVREHRGVIVAWVPDRLIPALRSHADVGFVEVNGIRCADGSPAPALGPVTRSKEVSR